jgi:hypothetical protein
MFQQNPTMELTAMAIDFSHMFSFLHHLTILSQIGFCLVAAAGVLYLLSRMPELLLVAAISFIYAVVPLVR